MLLLFVVLSVTLTLILGFALNRIYANSMVQEIADVSQQMLSMSSNHLQFLTNLAVVLVLEAYRNPDATIFMNQSEDDVLADYRLDSVTLMGC